MLCAREMRGTSSIANAVICRSQNSFARSAEE